MLTVPLVLVDKLATSHGTDTDISALVNTKRHNTNFVDASHSQFYDVKGNQTITSCMCLTRQVLRVRFMSNLQTTSIPSTGAKNPTVAISDDSICKLQ